MQAVAIHPSSCIDHKPEFCLYHEFVLTTKNYIRTVTDVKAEWLLEIAPEYFKPSKIKVMETRRELERVEKDIIAKKKYALEKDKKNDSKKEKKFKFHD
jgi:pre-mRNA-splicing factor ATP-dependent RNA helicase DHX15/PRP43